jgi:predicted double-glycine peptidase
MRQLLLVVMACALAPVAQAGHIDVPGAQGTTYSLRVTSLKEARFRQTVRQQYDFSCGSAAVATLLTYQYGEPVAEKTAFAQMYANGDQPKINKEGFSLLDIKAYLRTRGYDADGFEVPLDKLVEENLPAIVLIDERGYHHFVVVKGVRDGRVLVGDPATGTHSMSRTRFEAMWKNRIVFVIHNRREQASFNSATDWRVAPMSPLSSGIDRRGLGDITLPKLGPGDI